MASIINSQPMNKKKMKYELLMDKEEALSLRGNLKEVHFFSLTKSALPTYIMELGINNSTKYFAVPKEFERATPRERQKDSSKKIPSSVPCLFLDTKSAYAFVYVLQKKKKE